MNGSISTGGFKPRWNPAWEDTKVINSMKQHNIVYSYSVHRRNLGIIKTDPSMKMVDNSPPLMFREHPTTTMASTMGSTTRGKFGMTKSSAGFQSPAGAAFGINPLKSKPEREKDLVIDVENGSLINRMLQITEKGSMYNKQLLEKQIFKLDGTLHAPKRRKDAYQVNSENINIHQRLEKVKPTIRFNQIEKQFGQSTEYKKNITRASRRIFNCFVKTDQNKELLATSQSAYGRFPGLKMTASQPNLRTTEMMTEIQEQEKKKSTKKSKKSKKNKTELGKTEQEDTYQTQQTQEDQEATTTKEETQQNLEHSANLNQQPKTITNIVGSQQQSEAQQSSQQKRESVHEQSSQEEKRSSVMKQSEPESVEKVSSQQKSEEQKNGSIIQENNQNTNIKSQSQQQVSQQQQDIQPNQVEPNKSA